MLCTLTLEGVGPAKRMVAEFGKRLTVITGDNGLGKSFILDLAWWSLTRTWPRKGMQLQPRPGARKALVSSTVVAKGNSTLDREVEFDFRKQSWIPKRGRPPIPGLVIYAQVDGSFSVWDPARNYWKDEEDRPSSFVFNSREVWEGLEENGQWRCNGLYRDWASWQREKSESFEQLLRAIGTLSPPDQKLEAGDLCRVSPTDARDYPSIRMPYGVEVAVPHVSAAIRRILALAYLLIWTWREHLLAARQRRDKPAHRIIFLADEIEAHLHPAWQRSILPSLLSVVDAMHTADSKPQVQVVATTHSPLVCASVEPSFDSALDRLLSLDLDSRGNVAIEEVPFHKRGSGEKWLASPMFHLPTSYSLPAAQAIEEASRLVKSELLNPGSVTRADFIARDRELRQLLGDLDPFWVTWRRIAESKSWA